MAASAALGRRSLNMITAEEGITANACSASDANALPVSEKEQREIQEIYARLREAAAKLVGPDGKTQVLPNNVYSFLCRLLADLKAGGSVTILQSNAQLTTMEASKMLGTSRQFLINLLEKGEIPFHKVGTHRRIYARDILAYKGMRDAARRKALDDLVRAEHEEGIYSGPPNDSD